MSDRRKWDSTAPSFKVCIIIPLEVYEKECALKAKQQNTNNQANKNLNILNHDNYKRSKDILRAVNLTTVEKMKLFDQQFAREESRKRSRRFTTENPIVSVKKQSPRSTRHKYDDMVSRFQIEKQPFVRSILTDYIRPHKNSVDWDPGNKEIILSGSRIHSSDIIKALKYILDDEGVSVKGHPPIGTEQLFERLMNLGVPRVWFGRFSSVSSAVDKQETSSGEEEEEEDGSIDDQPLISPLEENESDSDDDDEISFKTPSFISSTSHEQSRLTSDETPSPKKSPRSPIASRTRKKSRLSASLRSPLTSDWHVIE